MGATLEVHRQEKRPRDPPGTSPGTSNVRQQDRGAGGPALADGAVRLGAPLAPNSITSTSGGGPDADPTLV